MYKITSHWTARDGSRWVGPNDEPFMSTKDLATVFEVPRSTERMRIVAYRSPHPDGRVHVVKNRAEGTRRTHPYKLDGYRPDLPPRAQRFFYRCMSKGCDWLDLEVEA